MEEKMESNAEYGMKVLQIIWIGDIITFSADGVVHIFPSCIGHVLFEARENLM